jgi:hypothetical protein
MGIAEGAAAVIIGPEPMPAYYATEIAGEAGE